MARRRSNIKGRPTTNGAICRYTPLSYDTGTTPQQWRNVADSSGVDPLMSTLSAWPTYSAATGATQYTVTPTNAVLSALETVTFGVWIKLTTKGWSSPFSKWQQLGGIILNPSGNPGYYDPGPAAQRFSTSVLSTGQWYHIGLVLNQSTNTGILYLNGSSILSDSYTVKTTTTQPLYVGQFPGFWFVDGQMDEVRLYDRALSSDEILRNYYAGINRHQ